MPGSELALAEAGDWRVLTHYQAVDLELDATPFLGNVRSKRYSMLIEDGVIKQLNVEPDGTGLSCSLSNTLFSQI